MSNLAIRPDQQGFTPQQVATLKQLGVDKVSDGDLSVFFHQCQRTGLDPFAKQIYLVGRFDSRSGGMRYTIQTGIDGYRLIAERTGVYAGSDESWDEQDGRLVSATVTVRKVVAGQVCSFSATARYSEYVQTGKDGKPMGLWAKMPHRMLAKCAEALALRKAFPQDLSGLYTSEEMSQADSPAEPARVEVTRDADPLVSAENIVRFENACKSAGLDPDVLLAEAGLSRTGLRESGLVVLREVFRKAKDAQIVDAEIVDDTADVDGIGILPGQAYENFNPLHYVAANHKAWVAEAQQSEESLIDQIQDAFNAEVVDKPAPQIKEPGAPASPKQLGMIRALLAGLDIKDDAGRSEYLSDLTKRPIGKLDELTKGEASTAITELKALQQ